MPNELVWIVPTRGRPDKVDKLIESFEATTRACTELVLAVDLDDDLLTDYYSAASRYVTTFDPVRPGMVATLNAAASRYSNLANPLALGFGGDDHLFRTVGWDDKYLTSLKRGNFFVYGDDGLQHENMPTQVAMLTEVVDRLGYMAPPQFKHLCIDLVWKDWGDALGRIEYLPDVFVEHVHPAAGKASWDDNYQRVNNPEITAKDAETYYAYKADPEGFVADVARLRELL